MRSHTPFACAGLLILASALGCSESSAPAPVPDVDRSPADAPAAVAADSAPAVPAESAEAPKAAAAVPGGTEPAPCAPGTGVLRGRVVFSGQAPQRDELSGPKSTAGCKHHDGPVLVENVIVNDGGFQNVVVYIKKGLGDHVSPPPPAEPLVLDQSGCVYAPHVSALRAGQPFLVKNSDAVTHNVNWRPTKNDRNNAAQAQGSPPVEGRFEKAEIGVPIGCDLHPWMKAWMCVFDHPYFAVSTADGSFVIDGLPPGSYEIGAWHEVYRDEWTSPGKKFTISDGLATRIEISYGD